MTLARSDDPGGQFMKGENIMWGLDEIKAMNARASMRVNEEAKDGNEEEAWEEWFAKKEVKDAYEERSLKLIRHCMKYDGPKYLRHEIMMYMKTIWDLQDQIAKLKKDIAMRKQVLEENGMVVDNYIRFTAFD